MHRRVLNHARAHRLAYALIFVALGAGAAFAATRTAQFDGEGRIISGRAIVAPPLVYPNFTPAGPVLLDLPGLGQFFASSCPTPELTSETNFTYRNTSGRAVDAFFVDSGGPQALVFAPGEERTVFAPYPAVLQLGAGTGKNRAVATITLSALFDEAANVCRYNAQAAFQAT